MAIRAAQYLRVSYGRLHQSIEQQKAVIDNYAQKHDLEVVRTYQDNGKSGLNLRKRAGLKTLLLDVSSGKADYRTILVHDVSRWGRFQDIDEAAYYEFLCKTAGVQVQYCTEGFDGEITPQRLVEKSLRRVMAAEFSRDLSVKVYRGQRHLAEMGFRVGAIAPYGFQRKIVASDGQFRGILGPGQRKFLQTDRTLLVPGPTEEIVVVREIFDLLILRRKTPTQIADLLNKRGVLHNGRRWWRSAIRTILTNPAYCGCGVWNRRSCKFRIRLVSNRPEDWIAKAEAFPAIVPDPIFQQAQRILSEITRERPTNETLLRKLKLCFHQHGRLSEPLMWNTPGMPSIATYRRHFGDLRTAYDLVGYKPSTAAFVRCRKKAETKRLNEKLVERVKRVLGRRATILRSDSEISSLLLLDSGCIVRVRACRMIVGRAKSSQWGFYNGKTVRTDLFDLLCLLTGDSGAVDSYFVVKSGAHQGRNVHLNKTSIIAAGGMQLHDLRKLLETVRLLAKR